MSLRRLKETIRKKWTKKNTQIDNIEDKNFINPFGFEINNYENYFKEYNDEKGKETDELVFTKDFLALKNGLKQRNNSEIELNKNSQDNMQNMVNELKLSEKSKRKLYKDCPIEPKTDARERFIKFYQTILTDPSKKFNKVKTNKINDAISMEDLLGTNGIELFKAALKEEENDRNFRNALLIKSTNFYEGTTLPKINNIIGGPSASGKTFGTQSVFNTLGVIMPGEEKMGNLVMSADGGNDREVSQMRRLLKNGAISLGYSGISNLHKHMKDFLPKSKIAAVADIENNNHKNSPETFSSQDFLFKIKQQLNDAITIYSEVRAPKDKKKKNYFKKMRRLQDEGDDKKTYFQKMTQLQGEDRAYTSDYGTSMVTNQDSLKKIPIDNYKKSEKKYTVESKIYEPENFSWGKGGSTRARKWYQAFNKDNIYVNIINDRVCAELDSQGKLVKCEPKSGPNVILLTERQLEKFNAENKRNKQVNVQRWLKEHPSIPYIKVYHHKRLIHDSVLEEKGNNVALNQNLTKKESSKLDKIKENLKNFKIAVTEKTHAIKQNQRTKAQQENKRTLNTSPIKKSNLIKKRKPISKDFFDNDSNSNPFYQKKQSTTQHPEFQEAFTDQKDFYDALTNVLMSSEGKRFWETQSKLGFTPHPMIKEMMKVMETETAKENKIDRIQTIAKEWSIDHTQEKNRLNEEDTQQKNKEYKEHKDWRKPIDKNLKAAKESIRKFAEIIINKTPLSPNFCNEYIFEQSLTKICSEVKSHSDYQNLQNWLEKYTKLIDNKKFASIAESVKATFKIEKFEKPRLDNEGINILKRTK